RHEFVGIHRQAHRTAGLAPVEAGSYEYLVETFGLGLFFHQARAGHDHRRDTGIDYLTVYHARNLAQVFDARVGAGADEHAVDRTVAARPGAVEFDARAGQVRGAGAVRALAA